MQDSLCPYNIQWLNRATFNKMKPITIVDDLTFRQLMESKHYHPEITDVIFDSDKMLEMGIVAINSTERGFDIVWDKIMFDFLCKVL